MKLARFWARQTGEAIDSSGQRIQASARGWSNQSMDEAAAVAREIAAKVAARVAAGQGKAKQYGYGDRPLPEPVIQSLGDPSGGVAGVITRNAYGALVLNSRDLMFVDIDHDGSAAAAPGTTAGGQDVVQDIANELAAGIASLFGKPKPAGLPPTPAPIPQAQAADRVVAGIQRVAQQHSLSLRIYKTAAGYRALIFNRRFDPTSPETEALLREFGSDALYIRLCKMQESFRARLTPKPWRLNMNQPPVSFPFQGSDEEACFYEWVGKYTAASAGYATCRFVAGYGAGPVDPALAQLIAFHDQETKVGANLPLA